jgi:hypothetical protein
MGGAAKGIARKTLMPSSLTPSMTPEWILALGASASSDNTVPPSRQRTTVNMSRIVFTFNFISREYGKNAQKYQIIQLCAEPESIYHHIRARTGSALA